MNSTQLLNLMNLLASIQRTQEKILEELKKVNASSRVSIKEITSGTFDRTPQ